ncbi:MAG: hypothetical protein M0R06_05880 [Sphaerochaeta sp.]|jgi:hypothetical protein|nr:hypothetical protein [Sphaerochaeta sp.]
MRAFGKTLGNGDIVREYLTSHGPAPVYDIWSHVAEVCKENGWRYPTYHHFMQFFWKLKKAELVVEDHREVITEYGGQLTGVLRTSEQVKERIFYKIVEKNYASLAWTNVQTFLYGIYD